MFTNLVIQLGAHIVGFVWFTPGSCPEGMYPPDIPTADCRLHKYDTQVGKKPALQPDSNTVMVYLM